MKQIIRIEHLDNGIGIFSNDLFELLNNGLNALAFRHNSFNTPDEDGLDIDKDGKEWFCAYKSIEQIQKWVMKNEIQKLCDVGFNVLLIEVTEFQEGRDQIIFTKESIISIKNINELFLS